MYIKNLKSKGKFLPDRPNKEDILKTDNFNLVVSFDISLIPKK